MDIVTLVIMLTAFSCSLVAGFLFAFAVVVMPGIRKLRDGDYIRAFQVIDGVIQENQPVFAVVWVGSILAVVASAALGIASLEGDERLLVLTAAIVYILGVQLPTFTVNVPLNNQLQTLDVDELDDASRKSAREAFEAPWVRWNAIRTVLSSLVSAMLMLLLYRL